MTADPAGGAPGPRPRREIWAIAALAVGLRLLHLWFVAPTPMMDYHRSFAESDMYMFDQWARRIAGGDVLSRDTPHPLMQWQLDLAPREKWAEWYGAAPVFYKAPFYAYLLAGLYTLFDAPMIPLAVLQIAAAGASVFLLAAIGEALFGAVAGRLAALVFALYGPAIHFDTVMLRGPWIQLAGLGVTLVIARLRKAPSARRAAAAGATVGLALLVNEGFLTLPPLAAAAVLPAFRGRALLRSAAAFALGMSVALAPVILRNVAVGAPPLKLAVTGGTVYTVFNAAQSSPYFFDIRPHVVGPLLHESGGTLGGAVRACLGTFSGPAELARFYAARVLGILVPFENPDNVNFYYAALKDPLLRALPGWGMVLPLVAAGLVLHARRWRALVPLAPVAASTLASIVLTTSLSRYRVTLVVALLPLAGAALARLLEWARARRARPVLATLAAMGALHALLVAAQARLVFSGLPEPYFLYRPSEFQVGANHYAAQGRFGHASAELAALLARNPDGETRAKAYILLATMELGRGDAETARQALEAARRVGAWDPVIQVLAGDVYRDRLGDPAAARAAYERAREIRPDSADVERVVTERIRALGAPVPAR
jgi:hypothetical protein